MEEHLATIPTVAHWWPPTEVPFHDALDQVMAEDIHAPDTLPPYPASIKDGSTKATSNGSCEL